MNLIAPILLSATLLVVAAMTAAPARADLAGCSFCIEAQDLAPGAVNGLKIQDGSVGIPDLAPGAVTNAKIAPGAVTGASIRDGAVNRVDLADGAVATAKIRDGAVTASKLAPDAVYARTVLVGPVGTPAQNGAALLAALAGIADASADNPYLLRLEPGVYDVGASAVTMKAHVDIEGSGEGVTRITGAGGGSDLVTGTIRGADRAELRGLTVETTGGVVYAIALYHQGVGLSPAFRVSGVTVSAGGGSDGTIGVMLTGSGAVLRDVAVTVTGSARISTGVSAMSFFGVLQDLRVSVTGNQTNFGLAATSAGGTWSRLSSRVVGGINAEALRVVESNLTVEHSRLEASGAGNNRGLLLGVSTGSYTLRLNHCTVTGADQTASVETSASAALRIGSSQLDGGPVTVIGAGGSAVCAGVYDESYSFFADSCP